MTTNDGKKNATVKNSRKTHLRTKSQQSPRMEPHPKGKMMENRMEGSKIKL